jgi:hypothetical protein
VVRGHPKTAIAVILVLDVGKHQWQHYLPQVYLAGFATSTGEVWRHDRAAGCLKLLGTPVIGAERDLYSLITGDELSHEIETRWFNPLDGCFGPILRKLEGSEGPSPNELSDLANFVAYLRVRTRAMIREAETRFRQFDAALGPDRDSITYHTGPPDRVPETFVMSTERSDIVSTQRDIETRRNDVLKLLVGAGMQLAGALLLLEWTILTAPEGRSFGQSDALLKRLVADLVRGRDLNLGKVLLREAPSVSNESRSILHSFTKSKIGPKWSCRVPMD